MSDAPLSGLSSSRRVLPGLADPERRSGHEPASNVGRPDRQVFWGVDCPDCEYLFVHCAVVVTSPLRD